MLELVAELAAEILPTVVYALGAGLLTVLGLLAERRSLVELAAGDTVAVLWLAGMGAVALYAGIYVIGYGELLPRLRGTGN